MFKVLLLCFTLFMAVNLSDVSFYEILGVSKQASSQEIRQAYKKLAVKFHPDKNPDVSLQDKFLKVTEAYETLKDADKRRKYDLYGSYPSYSRKYDYKSQAEYDNLFYNGLYHSDPNVDTLSGKQFYSYLNEGFYFINFYSPFCPPCQNVADHWKKLAEMYKGIVKVGAVNCKYHNSFCYNSMRISSYPTLLFYPNGKHGNYVYYQGDRTLEALDNFIMMYLRSKVHVPTVTQLRGTDRPIAYVLGQNRIDRNALTRIAYQLNGLVTLAVVEEDDLRQQLSKDDYTTVVFRYKQIVREIEGTDEKQLLTDIVEQLPKVQIVNPDKLKNIRNKLRQGSEDPWVLYFSSKSHDKLELHQMRILRPDLHFGEIDCDTWSELCTLLQVEKPPAWGVLKRGGAYQLVDKHTIDAAAEATNLHTLSASELTRIIDAGEGLWVLLVVPHGLSWSHIAGPFTEASLHFVDTENHNFGMTACSATTDHYCRRVARNDPTILVQNSTKLSYYSGEFDATSIVEFLQLLKDSADMELSESQVLDILDASSRGHTWLVAHLPAQCGRFCRQLAQEWMKVYGKLRPLEFVRVGILNCVESTGGFCTNIRAPTARLYPLASGQHYSLNLQQVTEAPYILEWALERIDDSVQKLNWNSFTKTVIAEELNPSSTVKPWLVYFHSPRCYRCYEMFADFAIAGILLNNAVNLGKVNCLTDRGICQHEQITSYPSLKLYLNRNHVQRFSSVVNIQVRDYTHMLGEVKPHLNRYNVDRIGVHAKHDEF